MLYDRHSTLVLDGPYDSSIVQVSEGFSAFGIAALSNHLLPHDTSTEDGSRPQPAPERVH